MRSIRQASALSLKFARNSIVIPGKLALASAIREQDNQNLLDARFRA
jgi:hypothetical protein